MPTQRVSIPGLDELFERASLKWPGLSVDKETYAQHLRTRLPDDEPTESALAGLATVDLYLACGCERGDGRALALFERHFIHHVDEYLLRLDSTGALVSEVQQVLRVRLLVGEGDRPPAIARYGGRGALGGWVRVSAVRAFLDLVRARKPQVGLAQERDEVAAGDLELAYLRNRHGEALRDSIGQALRALPAEDRNVLRWHFVDGMTTDVIGTLQHVDGSTIRRRILALRRRLLADVRARLGERLEIEGRELDSLVAALRSGLDLSVSRVLQRQDP